MKCVIAIIDEWTDTHGFMYVCDPIKRGLYESRTTRYKSEAKIFKNSDKALLYMKEHLKGSPFASFTMQVD